ncbi:aldose epimerase [Leptolyngbya sp. FACHB-261]|uniref:aldose epimerase family protein n=1 Tax=Leptolyngbya sp. FACHB-261 TaxID=2692806 RepID=UPI0016873E76|nr:aldose epimerase [Leptolyngbya sp. FACHB-261]MBD2099384.1 aldose epimerase [Leptolyngbya sp. FACHB-261]
MFSIAVKQEQYQTYILNDQAGKSRLELVPERGGIVTSWQVDGTEILYLDEARFADPSLSVRGGIPILFPICGNLPNNTYSLDGQTYTLKQHGFARDLPWTPGEAITQNMAQVTLLLSSSEQTLAVYPFEFELAFTYTLQGPTLTIAQRYTNRSARPMPFSTGLHPYFAVTDKSDLRFKLPARHYYERVTDSQGELVDQFDLNQAEIDAAFSNVSGTVATVSGEGRRLSLEFDPLYKTLVFWTLKNKEFYCLEPWSAPRNAISTGEHLTQLAPGASLDTFVRLRVESV